MSTANIVGLIALIGVTWLIMGMVYVCTHGNPDLRGVLRGLRGRARVGRTRGVRVPDPQYVGRHRDQKPDRS